MKTTLNLTYEDGAKVIHALQEVALKQGWNENDMVDAGIIEEFCEVVDAALTAMGIKVSIDATPSCEDEDEDLDEDDFDFDDEEDDEEDDDNDVVYSLTVKGEFALQYMEAGHTFEEACEVADILFGDGE